jgi:hypothetical protein
VALNGSDDGTSVASVDQDDDDLPSLVSDTTDRIMPFFDMFTLNDITNLDQW